MTCLLCRGQSMSKTHEHGAGRALWRCADCGLLQTFPMPSDGELQAYYQGYDVLGEREPYYRGLWGPGALSAPEGRDTRARFAWAKRHCRSFGRTLDVGSGPGLFLRLVKEDSGSPIGVELNAEAARRSQAELGVPVVAGTIADVADGGFDVVALWDLLEHVADPARLIADCRSRLKTGGWLFIETPDESSLLDGAVRALERLGFRGPARIFYGLHHLVLFRPRTVRRLLQDHGFEVVEIRGAATSIGRVFRGKGFKDKMARLGLGGLFLIARLISKRNKMLITAKKI